MSLQTVLFVLSVLVLGPAGCSKQAPPPPKKAESLHSHTIQKASAIAVPPSVAGKWKAVRIAVIDKTKATQKVYTVPVGGSLAIPAFSMNIRAEVFLPAFIIEGTTMTSSSNELTNPGVKVQITEKGTILYSGWLFSKFPNTHAFMHPKYGFTLVDVVPAAR